MRNIMDLEGLGNLKHYESWMHTDTDDEIGLGIS